MIGSRLAREIQGQFRRKARLIGLFDHRRDVAERLSHQLNPRVPILPPHEMIPRCDLLMEAASNRAVGELLPDVIAHKKGMLVMSTGGLLQHRGLLAKALHQGVPLYLPSGALAGIDGIKAASLGRLRRVTLTTRKPPKAFASAPEVLRRKIRLDGIRRPRILFEGTALKAASAFPQNINVAATLSLAGMGPVRTRVRVIADPSLKKNVHEVEAVGSFGRLSIRVESYPSPKNPKTSQLAVLSAVATLRQIVTPIRVGT